MIRKSCRLRRLVARIRKGTATVELAVCLPFMITLTMGSIEATNAIFLEYRLTAAAYEGARCATTPSQTTEGAKTAAGEVLTNFSIVGGSVSVSPDVTKDTATGTPVAVTTSAKFSSNSWMPPFILGKIIDKMTAKVVMNRQ